MTSILCVRDQMVQQTFLSWLAKQQTQICFQNNLFEYAEKNVRRLVGGVKGGLEGTHLCGECNNVMCDWLEVANET